MTRHALVSLAAVLILSTAAIHAAEPETKKMPEPHALPSHPTFGTIKRKDPRFDKLIPPDAKLEKLAEGFMWSEGPIWQPDGKFLMISDIPRNRVMRWQGDKLSVFLEPSGYTGSKPRGGEVGSNGLTLDHQGRLVLCQHGDRCIARL